MSFRRVLSPDGFRPDPSFSDEFHGKAGEVENGPSVLRILPPLSPERQFVISILTIPRRYFLYERRLLHDLSRYACEFPKIFKYYRKTFVQQALMCYLFVIKPNRALMPKKGRNLNLIMVRAPGDRSA